MCLFIYILFEFYILLNKWMMNGVSNNVCLLTFIHIEIKKKNIYDLKIQRFNIKNMLCEDWLIIFISYGIFIIQII